MVEKRSTTNLKINMWKLRATRECSEDGDDEKPEKKEDHKREKGAKQMERERKEDDKSLVIKRKSKYKDLWHSFILNENHYFPHASNSN